MSWYCGLRVIAKESRTVGEVCENERGQFQWERVCNVARPGVSLL